MTTTSPLPFFVLGAGDPEMDAIEALLREAGARFTFASAIGRRVVAGVAYEAYGVLGGISAIPDDAVGMPFDDWTGTEGPGPTRGTVWVECAPRGRDWPVLNTVGVCDHHREGDPGYGLAPADFLLGSSLGQVIAILAQHGAIPAVWERRALDARMCLPGSIARHLSAAGLEWVGGEGEAAPDEWEWTVYIGGGEAAVIPRHMVLTAALDHCPAAACRGECTGVGADEALAEFARRSGCTPQQVQEATAALQAAPPWAQVYPPDPDGFDYPGQAVRDPSVRDLSMFAAPAPTPEQTTDAGAFPGLRVAMMITGLSVVARVRMVDGREKVVLQGAGAGTLAGEEPVRVFLSMPGRAGMIAAHQVGGAAYDWLPIDGTPYGDPVRGYAGAVLR